MDTKRRRVMLFGTIILLGSILTILEVEPIILLLATVGMGILMLMVSGGVRLPRWGAGSSQKAPVAVKAATSPSGPGEKKQKRTLFAGLNLKYFSLALARIRPRSKKRDTSAEESIDKKLDRALTEKPGETKPAGNRPPAPLTGGMPAAPKNDDMDPVLALSNAELEGDLDLGGSQNEDLAKLDLSLSTEGSPSLEGPPPPEDTEPDEVAEILKAGENELGELGDLADAQILKAETGDLAEIDLSALDIDPETAPGSTAAVPKKEDKAAAPAGSLPVASLPAGKPFQQEKSEDMLAFAACNKGNDDIFSALKSDMRKVRTGKDPSLVRDMKDVVVQARDLEGELTQIRDAMQRRRGV